MACEEPSNVQSVMGGGRIDAGRSTARTPHVGALGVRAVTPAFQIKKTPHTRFIVPRRFDWPGAAMAAESRLALWSCVPGRSACARPVVAGPMTPTLPRVVELTLVTAEPGPWPSACVKGGGTKEWMRVKFLILSAHLHVCIRPMEDTCGHVRNLDLEATRAVMFWRRQITVSTVP